MRGALAPWCLAVALAVGGCGDVNGASQPFAGTTVFVSSGGEYQLHLLVPPWVPVGQQNGVAIFFVPSPTQTISPQAQLSDALYSLEVAGADGDPAAALAAMANAHMPPIDLTGKKAVTTASGAKGWEVSWVEGPAVYHREVFVAAPSSATFFLHFTATQPIGGDAGVTQMILSFKPLPSGAAAGAGGEP
jgi:hypothetical protein